MKREEFVQKVQSRKTLRRRQSHTFLVELPPKTMLFCIVLVLSLLTSKTAHCSATDKAQAQAVSKAHFEFGLDLYKSLNHTSVDQNVLISPYSINTLLAMLFMGTLHSSNSSMQLRSLMHFNGISYVDIHNQFKKIVENFEGNYYATKMKAVQGLYVASDVTISPPFDRALKQFYQAKVEHMDFRNADASQTSGLINEYVSEITGIQPMLEERPDSETRLLMYDAMALTSRWLYPFDPSRTFDKGLFYLSDDQRYVSILGFRQEKLIAMMHKFLNFFSVRDVSALLLCKLRLSRRCC